MTLEKREYEVYTFEVAESDKLTFQTLMLSCHPDKTIRTSSSLENGKKIGTRFHIPLTQVQYITLKNKLIDVGLKFNVNHPCGDEIVRGSWMSKNLGLSAKI